MPNNAKKLSVRLHGLEVGILEEKNGKMRFKYSEKAEFQLSLSLPIAEDVYPEKDCRGYFGGLLPENPDTRAALAKKYKISLNSDFALLGAIGLDCAGAVSFHEIGESEVVRIYDGIECESLTRDALAQVIKDLPIRPYVGQRMSLAGVQEKTAVCIVDDKVGLPLNDIPTTHILKPATKFKQSVQNEYICMKTAKAVGLDVAEVEIRKVYDMEFLLIERFDRHTGKRGIIRIQQEDFAQALGIWAYNKYDLTFKDCLKVLIQTMDPAKCKQKFVKCAVFNFLMGNCDAHGKNFSIFLAFDQKTLTPFYDILCTNAYKELDNDMAMKIGSQKYAKDVTRKDWEDFAQDLDVSPKAVFEELERQVKLVPTVLEKIAKEVGAEIGYEILELVNKNCEQVKKYI